MSELLEQRIEAAARAYYTSAGGNPDEVIELAGEEHRLWRLHSGQFRAAILASDAVLAQAGMVVVPREALTWLNGEGPDLDGYEFGERPDMPAGHRFWWRAVLRRWVAAAPDNGGGERDG